MKQRIHLIELRLPAAGTIGRTLGYAYRSVFPDPTAASDLAGRVSAHAVACPRNRCGITALAANKWAARVGSLSVLMAWTPTAPARVPGFHRKPKHQAVERGDYAQHVKGNGYV